MDFDDDDEQTVIDGTPLVESGETTPVEPPRCAECGAIVFDDDFDDLSLIFGMDRCIRSKPGTERPWHWCPNFSKTHGKYAMLVPR